MNGPSRGKLDDLVRFLLTVEAAASMKFHFFSVADTHVSQACESRQTGR